MLLLAMATAALLGAPAASPRRVSMWYAPGAYGGTDINASLDLLAADEEHCVARPDPDSSADCLDAV